MSEDLLRLYGTREREPESRTLIAGDLSVALQDGNLRTLRYRGHEVLRAVSFLVRDKDWGTCNAVITDLVAEETGQGFSVAYKARFTAPSGANLDCTIMISGTPERVAFSADCVSDGDFETARAGFVVLHPVAGVAGEPVEVRHGDGSVEHAHWPDRIEPWQPFKDIAAITHRVAPGISATTQFRGDIFEMEDQRNWTDGSYKTYVRPLALPWPYLVPKNEPFRQQVFVEGSLVTNSYEDREGVRRYSTQVRVDKLLFGGGARARRPPNDPEGRANRREHYDDRKGDSGQGNQDYDDRGDGSGDWGGGGDDDIPF